MALGVLAIGGGFAAKTARNGSVPVIFGHQETSSTGLLCSVTLNSAAPIGGQVVSIYYPSGSMTSCPSQVVVAQNQYTVVFTAQRSPFYSDGFTMWATCNGGSASAIVPPSTR